MTASTVEKYDADTSADDFLTADEPPEIDAPDGEDQAPYGWTRDRETGQLRPKKRPGRPAAPPGPDKLAEGEPVARAADRPPGTGRRGRGPVADADVPMPKGGVIAAGVNKLYRRAGKIIRVFDTEVGAAVIACTRPDDDGDLTVGEAWENLCKTNPRIRRAVLKAIAGGAVGDLVMAHMPIAVAFAMKPLVQRLIPFERLIRSVGEPDEDGEDGEDGEGDLPGGMTDTDFGEMQRLAEEQARQMAAKMGIPVTDEQLAEASARAAGQVPPAFRRQQPRNQSRAKRAGHR